MRFLGNLLLVTASLCSISTPADAQVAKFELPSVLSSGCVLQRNTRAPLWGKGPAGQAVSVQVSWSRKTYSGKVRPDGNWWIPIPTPDAGGPYTIALRCKKTNVLIENVLIGEVWVCSGQSNMEMPVAPLGEFYSGIEDFEEVLASAANDQLRLFAVPNELSLEVQQDCEGEWAECSPESLREFSSTAYFFGSELQRELGIPIGVISADYGGSRAEAWMSAQALRNQPDFKRIGELLGVPSVDESVLEELQTEAMRLWHAELVNREMWAAPRDWHSGEHEPEDDDWRGILWSRFEVELSLEQCSGTKLDMQSQAGLLHYLPVGLRIAAGVPWVSVRGPIGLSGNRDVLAPLAALGTLLSKPGEGFSFGINEVEVSIFASDSLASYEMIRNGFTLELLESSEASTLPDQHAWEFSRGLDSRDFPKPQNYHVIDRSTPTALFNAMIAPIMPYKIRGVIWYQGESNRDRPLQYRSLFPALIRDWRGWWRQGDFPFYYVQIAPYAYEPDRGRPAELREAQREALDELPNVGMAVTLDIGNAEDIHPKNKREVGRRLALWALAKDYGREDLVYSGPLDTHLEIKDNELRVHFDHLGGGLVAAEGGLRHFELAGPDLRWHPATAEIDGDTVLVRSDIVPNPRRVRYCGGAADEATLFNRAGLPAPSFTR